ncbi:PBSX family phage terminase large subunit [Ligilactobacillus acidipiscis]|uniref:PBSX family phage terminase large subunit n=1 Tax=Ligilactobacillus acidipiscis TaxID=89059 RepID=UPI0023F8F5D3|nr:PBSX family phage terminase large subunit [Ligilactobacillus acidipiscis]WEV56141.1 PBSX family phage terminase large subunit [Ligilactobacillus acidipiscis]
MTQMAVKITDEINPHFYKLWNTKKPYIIAKGGRGSFKSSVISLKLVTEILKYISKGRTANVICIRENSTYLRDSIFNQILWAIGVLGASSEFEVRKSPLMIRNKSTDSTFFFYGADNPMKLKSNLVQNIIAVWFEEAANFKSADVFDQAIPTFVRQKSPFIDEVKVYYSYNPPRNPYDWINEWIIDKENNPNYFVDTSTYLDDRLGFTTKQQLELINEYKANDEDYYRWLYLGEAIGLGTNIYNMDLFHRLDKLPEHDRIIAIYYSADTGHEVSATTCGCYGLTVTDKVILLDTYYYSPEGRSRKKSPKELASDLHEFIQECTRRYGMQPEKMTIDSAEGALDNQYYNDYGIRWSKVKKLKKINMIDRVHDLLAQGRFYYLSDSDNDIFIDEHKRYQWDENTLQSDDPKVIKENDHCCDQFQYLCRSNERDFGLKF